MLTIVVSGDVHFNESTEEFFTVGDVTLQLEHSLVSLSKWESFYEKPFLDKREKTSEEVLEYIKFMTLTEDFPPEVFGRLTDKNILAINQYINAKQTATWFAEIPNNSRSSEVVTSELIYYWMISASIPLECENWHLNRLFTLLRIFTIKNGKPKKMSRSEIAQRNAALNAQRREQYRTSG